jgi:hypothetical protein
MPRSLTRSCDDPFDGLLLPMNTWKALEDAQVTNLKQLRALAPRLDRIPSIDPDTAQIIKDRLGRLAARRTVRVRLIFPKRPHRNTGPTRNNSRRQKITSGGTTARS